MARRPSDGKWRALDGEAILKTYRLAAGYLYQAHLRAELSGSLGVEWETPRRGLADLKGVSRAAIDEFSTRRAQVVEHMDEHGTSGFWAAQVAAYDTRDRKEHVDLLQLREDWRARAGEHGFGRAELEATVRRARHVEPSSQELLHVAHQLLGPEGLTERTTAFSDADLVMAWAQAHVQGATADRVRRLASRFTGMQGVERVGEDAQPGRPARYSTAELVATERAALALVERGVAAGAPAAGGDALEQAVVAAATLSEEQREMVRQTVTSPDRVVCVVGLAGAGKTTATRVAADAFRTEGISVVGAAPSGIAAEKLQDETGIPSTTLHRLLQEELPDRCVVFVDEAGMAETRVLAPLLERIERAEAKLVLIGDPQQLPAVGAGGLFAGIVERHGSIEVGENRRQSDAEERRALEAIRNGLGRDYLAFAEGAGRLVACETPQTAKTRLLADWWAAARDDLPGNVMIALRRRDVAELNALARALMDTHRRLGRDRLAVGGAEYAVGDRVVCLRNSDAVGVKNGTRGTVERVDPRTRTLIVGSDRGDRIELSGAYLRGANLRHAYAITGHGGQGATVGRSFVLGIGGTRLQEWGYVALSRARHETRLYVTAVPRERESHFHDLDDRDSVTLLAQALEESAVERLAVDQRPLPSGPRHDTRAEIGKASPTTTRAIEQQKIATVKVRRDAERKLQEAQENTQRSLGTPGRKKRLAAEVTVQRRVIEMCDRQLEILEDGRALRGRPSRSELPVATPRTFRPTVDRGTGIEL